MIFECWRKVGWRKEERHEIDADTFKGDNDGLCFFRNGKLIAVLWGEWNVKPKEPNEGAST